MIDAATVEGFEDRGEDGEFGEGSEERDEARDVGEAVLSWLEDAGYDWTPF